MEHAASDIYEAWLACCMTATVSAISSNLQQVRRRIEDACLRAGRRSSDVRLVAVTKYARPQWIRELTNLGVADLGESRPQQLLERTRQFAKDVRWHLIGHLQRNKVRRVLPLATLIHSVDSLRLLTTIDQIAADLQLQPRLLLEVNVSGEAAKDGFSTDELLAGWSTVCECRNVKIEGLMALAPDSDIPEASRPVFRSLRQLRDKIVAELPPCGELRELSMGMSGDFEVAIEEGATLVRIGSELFRGLIEND